MLNETKIEMGRDAAEMKRLAGNRWRYSGRKGELFIGVSLCSSSRRNYAWE